MGFDYSQITPSPEAARAALERMSTALAADTVNALRARLLERWPTATELRWTRAPGDDGVLRHALLLDARGRLLATGDDFAVPRPLRGAVFVHELERHSGRLSEGDEPASWSLDLTFERARYPNG